MSNSCLPCRDPHVYPSARGAPEIVLLEVGYGDDFEVLEAPLRLLRLSSEYFHERLNGTSDFFTIPDSSPYLFRVFLDFLTTGSLDHSDSDDTQHRRFSFGELINIFAFSKKFEIDTLRNAVLDEFFLRIADRPARLPYRYISDIYEATMPNSSLRSLVVDAITYIGTKQEIQEWEDKLPEGFMTDCLTAANEDNIVPFLGDRCEDDVLKWLDDMKQRLCDLFHLHDFEPEPPRPRPPMKRTTARMRRRERRREEKEALEGSEEEEEEMDPERQKMADDDAAERMRYLMEPLPVRVRY
ncbi:hypothetical protein ACET3X_006823 [Alternaria dauci]|uniref:BTB domain-containing protein n=1 Tax=Alternaria dauci TaxID=48095 RepID=A0ABR3UES9_9PLEO